MTHDVFISYSSKDTPWAESACSTLEANGVRCWMAPRDIPEGVEYPAALADALRSSRALVLIFSASSNESPQVQREVERALALQIPVIPFRIEVVPLSRAMEYLISTPQWLDVDARAPEKSVARLVPAAQKLLSAPATALEKVIVPRLPKLVRAHRRLRQLQLALVAVVLLAAAGFASYFYGARADEVIVMPFQNNSGEPELDAYMIAFPTDIITALMNLPRDRFVAKPNPETLRSFARSGVDSLTASKILQTPKVLTGGFERGPEGLSFHADLSIPSTGAVRWIYPDLNQKEKTSAQSCLKDPSNRNRLLPLRRVILEGVLQNLPWTPSEADRRKVLDPPTNSCEAYDLYIQARALWNTRNREGFIQAIALYQKALDIDEKFALARSGLADCYNLLADYSIVRPTDEAQGFPAAIQQAELALKLQPNLAEAHVAKAFYLFQHRWRWKEAEEEFRLAFETNPNYPTGLQWKAVYLSAMGRHQDALLQITDAMKFDNTSPILGTNKGWLLRLARRDDEAEKELLAVLSKTPEFEEAHRQLGDVYLTQRKYQRALEEYTKAEDYSIKHGDEGAVEYEALIARARAFLENKEKARQAAQSFEERYARQYFPASYIALIYIALGDKDSALKWLNQSYEDRSDEMILLKVDPAYDSLRNDPRFDELVKRIGLP
ncbi:MAG TPA: TIR domain-containing protein [Terriglobia bacterium]|nr:TIR domain-containing protein [Terriglobia bacterium]